MGRGQIFALTLAALAAVCLQGCGKKAVPPAPTVISTTLTAAAKKGATVMQIASTIGFLPNSKVTIADPTTKKLEVNAVSAVQSIILMAPLQNDYGVGSTVTMVIADAGKTTTLSQITTSALTITSVNPQYIHVNKAETIQMTGPALTGDLLSLGTACGNETLPSTAVTVLSLNTSSVAVPAVKTAGTYFLCYRGVGKTDSVAQTKVPIYVQVKGGSTDISAATYNAANGGDDVAVTGTVKDGDQIAWVTTGTACPLGSSFLSWTKLTAGSTFTVKAPDAKGDYDLCFNGKSSTPAKQTDVKLTVAADKAARLYRSAIVDVDEVADTKADDSSVRNMLLGAGGLVLVAFVVVGVKRVKSLAVRDFTLVSNEVNLEEPSDDNFE